MCGRITCETLHFQLELKGLLNNCRETCAIEPIYIRVARPTPDGSLEKIDVDA